jgi:hypothetical protein
MPQDMPPAGGYDAVQYKVGFCLFLIGVRLGVGDGWNLGEGAIGN